MRSKIPEIKELTNQPEKHHLSTLKDTSMAFVNNHENSIRICTTEHPTKLSTIKQKQQKWESFTEKTTAKSLYNTFDKRIRMPQLKL